MAVRTVTRRGQRRLVIDFSFRRPDGTKGRYRHDAEVQTMATARAEERRRLTALSVTGSPFEVVDEKAREQVVAPVPRELTFAEVADKYLAEFAPSHLKASTRFLYTSAINAWLKPHLGALPIGAINAKAVRDLEREMSRARVGPSAKRAYLIALYSVVKKYAVEAELLDKVPKLPKLPKKGRTIPCVMAIAEFMTLLAKGCQKPWHRLVFLLAAHGGLRRSEIRALRCRDVELVNNRLIVRTAIYRNIEGTPKSGHEREVPLTPELREALIVAGVEERDGSERVSLSTKGKTWPESSLRGVFIRALRRAGLTRWRLHDLRHFFVTALLNASVPAHVVRELAGHADLATTQRYAHATARDRGVAITALSTACARASAA